MVNRYDQRDTPARIEALIQAALSSDEGRRKIAAAHTALNMRLSAGKLTAEEVLDTFKRHVDISVSNTLSRPCEFQVGYHAYAASGLAAKVARRLADEYLSRAGARR